MEEQKLKAEVKNIVDDILKDYEKDRDIDIQNVNGQPDKDAVVDILNKIIHIIYPGYFRSKVYKSYNDNYRMSVLIEDVIYNLRKQIRIALMHRLDYVENNYKYEELSDKAERLTLEFFKQIPKIREYVDTDIQATFEGDPAAYDKEGIVLSYPGLRATTINRIAHELYLLDVPLIPRIMTEYAHSRTGIDIHPGATLGKYLMIDHGTGVVVGETSIIGEHVKIYQGVTIGALSTSAGQGLRGARRHPTIEDHVTIYSGASILGGETVIGEGAVIGGNAFITSSIKAGARVSIKNQELSIKGSGTVETSEMDMGEAWFYMI